MTIVSRFSELMGMQAENWVSTSAANDELLASTEPASEVDSTQWTQWIDRLLQWWQFPAALDGDDGMEVSRDLIGLALKIAHEFSKNAGTRSLPPFAIVPNGDGGLTFHFRLGAHRWSIEILSTGHIDIYEFVDGVLVSSNRI
jgi:hypothetical protein